MMHRTLHLTPLLMLLLTSHALAQSDWIVDTLFADGPPFSRGGPAFVTSGDTIAAVWFTPGDDRGQLIMVSTNKGDTWDSTYHPLLSLEPQIPTMGLGIAGVDGYKTFAMRGRDAVRIDTTSLRFLSEEIHPIRHNLHPFRLNESFVKAHFSGPLQTIYFDYWFHRTSDDTAWREILMPRHSRGYARGADITFDYADPNRIWLNIDGGYDETGTLFEPDGLYSDDLGRTWTRVAHEIPPLMGMFKPGYGLRWTNRGQTPFKEPSLFNPVTGDSIHLGWYEKIRAEFAKQYSLDGWNFTMKSTEVTAPNVTQGYWVHPANRKNIIALVVADSSRRLPDTTYDSRTAHYLSEDGGETWKTFYDIIDVVKNDTVTAPTRSHAIITTDGSTILVPMIRLQREGRQEIPTLLYTLRFRRRPTSIATFDVGNHGLTIMPQPASMHVTIACTQVLGMIHRVAVHDVTGARVMQINPEPTQQLTLAVDALPSGVYMLHVTTMNGSNVLPLCISH